MASVRRLLLAVSYDQECDTLHYLLQPPDSTTVERLDVDLLSCEPPVLPSGEDDDGRNNSQSILEDLLLYVVVRKFGATIDSAGGKMILGFDQRTLAHWNLRSVQPAGLENFVEELHRLLLKSEWDAVSVSTLSRVVKRLQDPQTRQRFLSFVFQILRQSSPKISLETGKSSDLDAKFFDEGVRLLLLGVTDLWSAIRKDCAKAAAAIAFEFSSHSHIEQFMDSLLYVAIGSRSVSADKSQVTVWTEREGALLTLSVLLRSIKMEIIGEKVVVDKGSTVKDDIKGILGISQVPAVRYYLGRHTLPQLPRCLVQKLKPAIYQCLRHDQVSVRQLAAQCLVDYASLCEEPTRLLIFQEVISKLNRINRNDKVGEINIGVNPDESELLDAFEAEGLLDVLARMAPCLPSSFLLKHWKFVFPTLEKYVMHIASSVRQKSSSVVLALAKQSWSCDVLASSSDETSLKLVVQMLLSLSKPQIDENSLCWQRKEGRLLSIEVLINVLGESLLECTSEAGKLLRWKPEPAKIRQRRSSSFDSLQTFLWAHDQAQSATWVFGSEAEEHLKENDHARRESDSLVYAISIWIEKNNGQNGLSVSSNEFWQQVLGGCLTQTKEAFESSQFELRRISRQVLPGLMRLVIWTDQLTFLSLTEIETASAETSWRWMCVEYILLHLRYLEEGKTALGENIECTTLQSLATNWKTVWNSILALESKVHSTSIDRETVVAKMEVKMMAFLSFGAAADPPRQVTRLLDGALQLIHAQLPKPMQLLTLMTTGSTSSSDDNSLDRQFCIFLVPILPVIVTTLQYLDERHASNDSSFSDAVQSLEGDLSWSSRWLCLERIIVAWLLCDDMFRWITRSKLKAQTQLLESLSVLLRFPKTDLSHPDEGEEVDRIVQCLRDTFPVSPTKNAPTKDTVYTSLVDIYLQLWLRCIKSGSQHIDKVASTITQLYSRQQQSLAIADAKTKSSTCPTCPTTESWNDWDNDEGEVQQASPVGELQEPLGLSTADFLFQEVLEYLDVNQLNLIREAARTLPNLAGIQDIPTEHVARMQQQIDACVHTS